MKRTLSNAVEHEVLALVKDIAFASVPSWYGATRRNLEMDLIVPKERNGHAPMPLIVWICGGAFRCVDRAVWLPELLPLARHGYVIAGIEYRTVGEGDVRDAYCDVKSAIRYLKAHAADYCIDPGRVASPGGIRRRHALPVLPGPARDTAHLTGATFWNRTSGVQAVVRPLWYRRLYA